MRRTVTEDTSTFTQVARSFFLFLLPVRDVLPDETKKIWMPDTFIDQAINLRKPTYYLTPHSLR